MDGNYGEWTRKGATISDKTARAEFGLTQQEIVDAMKEGKLQYRVNYVYDNPWYRLLRREVEALVKERGGSDHLAQVKAKAELAKVERELRRLHKEIKALEEQRAALLATLGE
jgi:hypothetical protein